jgi:hypothetical protein
MNQIVAVRMYQLDDSQNAAIEALAQEQHKEPDELVREAVARYLNDVVQTVDDADEAEYQQRIKEILASPSLMDDERGMIGSWSGVDGVEYQNGLRSK